MQVPLLPEKPHSGKACHQLMVNGIKPVNLSLDNYFVNREETPRDEKGEYDYESIDALDIATFSDNVQRLIQGEEIENPRNSPLKPDKDITMERKSEFPKIM